MNQKKICSVFILSALLMGVIYSQAASDTTDQDCTIKSVEETILSVEGGCRCTYTNPSGQKLIGVGYVLSTDAQLNESDLASVVSGDLPLKTDQILELLTSSSEVAISDLSTLITDFRTYPAVIQVALVRIYYDLTLTGLQNLSAFINLIQSKKFDDAATLLQYTDETKSQPSAYCAQQKTSCSLNAKLISECYQEEVTKAQAQNTAVSVVPPAPNQDVLKDLLINTLKESTCNFIGACTSPKSNGFGKSKVQDTIQPYAGIDSKDQNTSNPTDSTQNSNTNSTQDSTTDSTKDSTTDTTQDSSADSTKDSTSDSTTDTTAPKKKKKSNKSVKSSENSGQIEGQVITNTPTTFRSILSCWISLTSLLVLVSFI